MNQGAESVKRDRFGFDGSQQVETRDESCCSNLRGQWGHQIVGEGGQRVYQSV